MPSATAALKTGASPAASKALEKPEPARIEIPQAEFDRWNTLLVSKKHYEIDFEKEGVDFDPDGGHQTLAEWTGSLPGGEAVKFEVVVDPEMDKLYAEGTLFDKRGEVIDFADESGSLDGIWVFRSKTGEEYQIEAVPGGPHKRVVLIREFVLDEYEAILDKDDHDREDAREIGLGDINDGSFVVAAVDFGNGVEMDVRICGENCCGEHPALWSEAILFRDGEEIAHTECAYDLRGGWSLTDDSGAEYIVEIAGYEELGKTAAYNAPPCEPMK